MPTTPFYLSSGSNNGSQLSPITPGYPASPLPGDLLLCHVNVRATDGAITVPSGWTTLFGPDDTPGTTLRAWTLGKISDGTETGTLSLAWTGTTTGAQATATIHRFGCTNQLNRLTEAATVGSGSTQTITMPTVAAGGTNRLAVALIAAADDNPVADATGETGGTWLEAVAEHAATAGADSMRQLQIAALDSGGTISGGTTDMGTGNADPWVVRGFALVPPPEGWSTDSYALSLGGAGGKADGGGGSLVATVALGGTGIKAAAGGATLAATVGTGGVGTKAAPGTGDMVFVPILAGTGTKAGSSGGTLAATVATGGAGARAAAGGATLAATAATGGGGTKAGAGGATLDASCSLGGSGARTGVGGTGDLPVTCALGGTGTKAGPGTGDMVFVPILAGTGSKAGTARGDLVVTVATGGTGIKAGSSGGVLAASCSLGGQGTKAATSGGLLTSTVGMGGGGSKAGTGGGDLAAPCALGGKGASPSNPYGEQSTEIALGGAGIKAAAGGGKAIGFPINAELKLGGETGDFTGIAARTGDTAVVTTDPATGGYCYYLPNDNTGAPANRFTLRFPYVLESCRYSFRVKPSNLGISGDAITAGSPSTNHSSIRTAAPGQIRALAGNTTYGGSNAALLVAGQWNEIVASFDSGVRVQAWVNGVQVIDAAMSSPQVAQRDLILLGYGGDGEFIYVDDFVATSRPYDDTIDGWRITGPDPVDSGGKTASGTGDLGLSLAIAGTGTKGALATGDMGLVSTLAAGGSKAGGAGADLVAGCALGGRGTTARQGGVDHTCAVSLGGRGSKAAAASAGPVFPGCSLGGRGAKAAAGNAAELQAAAATGGVGIKGAPGTGYNPLVPTQEELGGKAAAGRGDLQAVSLLEGEGRSANIFGGLVTVSIGQGGQGAKAAGGGAVLRPANDHGGRGAKAATGECSLGFVVDLAAAGTKGSSSETIGRPIAADIGGEGSKAGTGGGVTLIQVGMGGTSPIGLGYVQIHKLGGMVLSAVNLVGVAHTVHRVLGSADSVRKIG